MKSIIEGNYREIFEGCRHGFNTRDEKIIIAKLIVECNQCNDTECPVKTVFKIEGNGE